MIEISEVSKWYGNAQVLRNCSLNVNSGEVVVICGPSGSGKSTLIKTVNGLEPYQSGKIKLEEQQVTQNQRELRQLRQKVGMVFQAFELYPHLCAIENVCLAQRVVLKRGREEARDRAAKLLARVGLADHVEKYPGQLSGGQQQRVAIARALAMDPKVMLFDEPTSALDPEMINEVLEVMTELARSGMTMMVVTHEMGFARRVADRVVFMDDGEVVEDRETASFFSAPQSDRAQQFLSKILEH